MSKMKHLLRKLHIGRDHNRHRNNHHTRPLLNRPNSSSTESRSPSPSPSRSPSPPPPPSSSAALSSSTVEPISHTRSIDSSDQTGRDSVPTPVVQENVNNRNPIDFNFLEEEFQVQLALALSASDPDTRKDVDSDLIKAARQLSLGCPLSVADNQNLSEILSLKYWNYDILHYDEKIVDGFYDVYAITSNSLAPDEMPFLVDLQAISISDKLVYEVILVNRIVDAPLRDLESRAYAISVECQVLGRGPFLNGLIRRIADLVVNTMGGPVNDAKEIRKRWITRSNEMRSSLHSVVLPLGSLDTGLSCHRALLFKVLADRINLPCMLVKGSLYTGTDEGAVNLIKMDDGSEYIIDLMGAPGELIPAEIPSTLLLDTVSDARVFPDNSETTNKLNFVLDRVAGMQEALIGLNKVSDVFGPYFKEPAVIGLKQDVQNIAEPKQMEEVQHEYINLVQESSFVQENQVNDVSQYVISAAQNPEFAQKLHDVLLECGTSPPLDMFPDMNSDLLKENKAPEQKQLFKGKPRDSEAPCHPNKYWSNSELSLLPPSGVGQLHISNFGNELEFNAEWSATQVHKLIDYCIDSQLSPALVNGGVGVVPVGTNHKIPEVDAANCLDENDGCKGQNHTLSDLETGRTSAAGDCHSAIGGPNKSHNPTPGKKMSPILGEVAEWEIPWEDLQIGDRIGIGSYGEVYHAEWNGTEVAVKKFLVQDFSGYTLAQFKCEAELMIRLRHPNVVLFMGAVTRPPNLSILTEYLPRGSLYRLLHRSNTPIDEKRRLKMALDVAKGMNYLHTSHPTIVHRDLKTPNLLVDKNWGVKVCDFGMSRLKHHTFLSSKSTAGTPEWMAPEVLRNEPANEKCDVYSFGVILWELATLRMPWTGLNPMQVVGAVGFQNRRLEISEDIDPTVSQIIRDCWENDPNLRPSFTQLIFRLKGLQCFGYSKN